jgi:hypothetical protein
LIASSGADGRFRTLGIPHGRQILLFRRIGFRPRTLTVTLRSPVQALDTVELEESPILLPELGVEAKLQPPSFYPDSLGNLDDGFRFLGYQLYLANGAAMSSAHVFMALLQSPYKGEPPWIESRGYLSSRPDARLAGRTYGYPCGKRRIRTPLATALDEPPSTYRILSRDGLVFGGVMPDVVSMGDCIQSISLSVPTPLAAATSITRGWAVVSAKGRDSARVLFVNLFGRVLHAVLLRDLFGREVSPDGVALSPSRRGAIVALRHSPYLWVELDSAGVPLVIGGPFETTGGRVAPLGQEAVPGWISYGVLPIERGYIQQLEKPDRTGRRLLLYDVLGRPSDQRGPSSMPLFIASLPEQRRLLAIKYLDPWGRNTRLYEYGY